MAQKIDAAADHGVDVFIFDWYYYNDGPFLERPIDSGFLKAQNYNRIKFAFMWANHDWIDLHPYKRGTPQKLMFPGTVTPESFEKISDLLLKDYFSHPSYWRIDGKPYFSFYDLTSLLKGFGSVEATRVALDKFRAKAVAAGMPGLHLNAILWGEPNLPGSRTPTDWPRLCRDLALDTLTGYTWVHHGALNEDTFPTSDYSWGRDRYLAFLDHAMTGYPVPYFPNTTVHWDNSPRAHADACWDKPAAHVVNPVMTGNTPAAFKEATRLIANRLIATEKPQPYILTVNAWNEWPEGSCLEPGEKFGLGYLEALQELFGPTGEIIASPLRTPAVPV
jgi:hypothetical protein